METVELGLGQPVEAGAGLLGGAGLVMFGMVVATGIKVLSGVSYRDAGESRNNLFIVAVSVVVGMMPLVNAQLFSRMPQWMSAFTHSGIVLAALCALVLNLYLNGQHRQAGASARADGPARAAP